MFIFHVSIDSATSLIESKILGGEYVDDSMQKMYSYIVFITNTEPYEVNEMPYVCICTGSLISVLHVLSAAHCTYSGKVQKYVNVEGIRIKVGSNIRTDGTEYSLAAVYIPSSFNAYRDIDSNDIALMLVNKYMKTSNT